MKRVERYIVKTVLGSIGLVTLMLVGLQIFILLVNQIDDIGKADYGVMQAIVYVLLQLPDRVCSFFPMASLLGCLIGLGMMANHRELVVMRAAGMSIPQITKAVLKIAFVLIIVVSIFSETLVPDLVEMANDYRISALSGGQTLRTSKGVWLRYQKDFIVIGEVVSEYLLTDVYQFQFDQRHQLHLTRKLKRIQFIDSEWHATGVDETIISGTSTTARTIDSMIWEVPLKPNSLHLSRSEPEEMTFTELSRYLRIQKKQNQSSLFRYKLAFWQRLIQPITTLVMMLLAIPFIFGPLRSSTIGSKFLVGTLVGFGFYMFNRFFGPMSYVLHWPAPVAALGPTVLFVGLGLILLRRVR